MSVAESHKYRKSTDWVQDDIWSSMTGAERASHLVSRRSKRQSLAIRRGKPSKSLAPGRIVKKKKQQLG
jgi:hypothetical protein